MIHKVLYSLPKAFPPVLGTVLSEQMKISKHKKGALKRIGYLPCLDSSIKDEKNWMLAWNKSCHVSFTLQPCRIANRYYYDSVVNCETGRLDLGGKSGTISLLLVKFLSMANYVLFRLPFAKVKEMETLKTLRDNGISDADILSFCGRLECDVNLKNMWEY